MNFQKKDRNCFLKIVFSIFTISILTPGLWAGFLIDMSEQLLKVQEPAVFNSFQDQGFAVFDVGEKKLKFFDWKFQVKKSIPLGIGQGPQEIRQSVQSVCSVGNQTYLVGIMENYIKVFDSSGTYKDSIKLNFIPKKMVCRDGKLYVFNMQFLTKKENPVLGKSIETNPGFPASDILLKGELDLGKLTDVNPMLLGLSTLFDMGENKKIYILMSAGNILLEIDENGKLSNKFILPYKERKEIIAVKEGEKVNNILTVLDWYHDMIVVDKTVCICFQEHVGKEKDGSDRYKTHVIKILPEKKRTGKGFTEKILEGRFVFIGNYQNYIYLFDVDNYRATRLDI